ncbi:SDR family NAD(P)-dependent oxidoreductase [Phytohalomonas tamaricis]|uniref:SDR family NAD(P)-dependent oxidoreductase n=1 Tax=Phytohalomonas tamaricis TaxID=2081032 RepID=UPI000D0B3AF6|nr:SDR family NAD(P)-dependent oxidoreductase [Phytohalomonas tamaricis]
MTTSIGQGTALITGASSVIGAVYAKRLAERGYDLILVARNRQRLVDLANAISNENGRAVETMAADLNNREPKYQFRWRGRILGHVCSRERGLNGASRTTLPVLYSRPSNSTAERLRFPCRQKGIEFQPVRLTATSFDTLDHP